MRDADLDSLLAEDIPPPDPARRRASRAMALEAFERRQGSIIRRGIGAALARHLVRSSAPLWRTVSGVLDSPWTSAWLTLSTSLAAVAMFTAALIAAWLVTG